MDEDRILNEEEVLADAEEANADAAGETAEEETKTEGIVEELENVVEGIAQGVDAAAAEFASETRAAVEGAAEKADAAAEEFARDTKAAAEDITAKIKALVKEGNVTFIRIRKDDTVVLNLPMTVGIIGTVLGLAAAPWMVIIATITTIGLKCTVEVEKKDGTIVTIHGKDNKDK